MNDCIDILDEFVMQKFNILITTEIHREKDFIKELRSESNRSNIINRDFIKELKNTRLSDEQINHMKKIEFTPIEYTTIILLYKKLSDHISCWAEKEEEIFHNRIIEILS